MDALIITVPVCLGSAGCVASKLNYNPIAVPEERACHCRTSSGQNMVLKIASLHSTKHHSLKHQKRCLLPLQSLWGECVSHVLLAGALRGHGHGYGRGTTLLQWRPPASGTNLLLTTSKGVPQGLVWTVCFECKASLHQPFAAGDEALLQVAEVALKKVRRCNIMVNDLHRDNIVVVPGIDTARVFFIDFSHSIPVPSLSQCEDDLRSLSAVFAQLA